MIVGQLVGILFFELAAPSRCHRDVFPSQTEHYTMGGTTITPHATTAVKNLITAWTSAFRIKSNERCLEENMIANGFLEPITFTVARIHILYMSLSILN